METKLIPAYILISIAFIIEAYHDKILANKEQFIRLMANEIERELQQLSKEAWHRLDWWYLVFMSAAIGFTIYGFNFKVFLFMLSVSMLKILVFNIIINKLLKLRWNHLSNAGFEGKFKGKESVYYLLALLGFLTSVVLLWILN